MTRAGLCVKELSAEIAVPNLARSSCSGSPGPVLVATEVVVGSSLWSRSLVGASCPKLLRWIKVLVCFQQQLLSLNNFHKELEQNTGSVLLFFVNSATAHLFDLHRLYVPGFSKNRLELLNEHTRLSYRL